MALDKKDISISFGKGLNQKIDPKQVNFTQLSALSNGVFNKQGRLDKRNGYPALGANPTDPLVTSLSTHGTSLVSLGSRLQDYSAADNTWFDKGRMTPVGTSVVSLVRTSSAQSEQDAAVASNGVICSVWKDSSGGYKYQVSDAAGTQVLTAPTSLPANSADARVVALGTNFVVFYLDTTLGTSNSLYYILVPITTPSSPGSPVLIASNLPLESVTNKNSGYDALVVGSSLFVAFESGALNLITQQYNSSMTLTNSASQSTSSITFITCSLAYDASVNVLWVSVGYSVTLGGGPSFYISTIAYNGTTLSTVQAYNLTVNNFAAGVYGTISNHTSAAYGGYLNIFANLSDLSSIDRVYAYNWSTSSTGSATFNSKTGVRVAAKAVAYQNLPYVVVRTGLSQPTYFLLAYDRTLFGASAFSVIAKLAYSNAGSAPTTQTLAQANVNNSVISYSYLYAATLVPVNKTQGLATTSGIYAQTGINMVSWTLGGVKPSTADIAGSLHITGGFTWMYDGVKPVELGFHLWPQEFGVTGISTTGGSMTAQDYYYQACFEWTDGQGNIHRSAPSIPVGATIGSGTTGTVTLRGRYLQLTEKLDPNPVRIVIYRWSTAQQNYYRITSVTNPLLNVVGATVYFTYTDTQADSSILGNDLIYTTGGVVENIGPPAMDTLVLYRNRLVGLNSENKNVLWYSKQVIQNVPVEMTDLFTLYIGPTIGSQGSTGEAKALGTMDDKLIVFKDDAIYYITGVGPDNTGLNNDFSDPVFITAATGCANPQSVVTSPNGIMFQSPTKGIWLLGRDLSTTYIGNDVEDLVLGNQVVAASTIPGTYQIRFKMSSGVDLIYDYYFQQWGTSTGIPGISATVYGGADTYLSSTGGVYTQDSSSWTDVSGDVALSLTTSWLNFSGLQGLERMYFFNLIGSYLSAHQLRLDFAYDYDPTIKQTITVTADSSSSLEQFRFFLNQQKCQAVQVTITEIPTVAGPGLNLSGILATVGVKKGRPTLNPSQSAG